MKNNVHLKNVFGIFSNNAFSDECKFDGNIIEKLHLTQGILSDYGIYAYFQYSDNIYRSKMIAVITDKQYMITTGHYDKSDHLVMHYDIEERIGKYYCFLGSSGDELNVFAKNSLTINQLNILIDIFKELNSYYLDNGIDKHIRFIGTIFSDEFNNCKSCSNIEEIIQLLIKLMGQKENEKNLFHRSK